MTQYLSPPGEPTVEQPKTVDGIEGALFSGGEFVSLIASETDLLYVLLLFILQGEDRLTVGKILDDRHARMQEALRQALLDLLNTIARDNYELFPHYHLFVLWVCVQLNWPVIQRVLTFVRQCSCASTLAPVLFTACGCQS